MITSLSKPDCEALLKKCHVGHLSCITEQGPYVVPLHYIVHEGDLYLHSRVGKKIHAMRRNPAVCFQVEERLSDYRWHSVIAFGTYEEIIDPDEHARFNRQILTRFPHLTPVESLPADGDQSDIIIFRIRVGEITGRREG